MEIHEDYCDSLPYIDDPPINDETVPHQYNLKITENYHNKNRDIVITNRFLNDVAKSSRPVAPLAEEQDMNEFQQTNDEARMQVRSLTSSGVKLVINGWNSSISIQGLDDKSFITFKRRYEKVQRKESRDDERKNKSSVDESKPRKGRWKMLTKSLMLARSARFDRRTIDERYPKYVLLKNEDENLTKVRENYPKMFVFNEKKQKSNQRCKPEFNFKKSFKNKTEPIVPLEEILVKADKDQERKPNQITKAKQKQVLTDSKKNLAIEKKIMNESKMCLRTDESTPNEPADCMFHRGYMCGEIKGIFQDAFKILPQSLEVISPDAARDPQHSVESYDNLHPQFCQFSCHDPYCCLQASDQTSKGVTAYPPSEHPYKNSRMQTQQDQDSTELQNTRPRNDDLDNFPFGILSTIFPRVVIMNSIQREEMREEETVRETSNKAKLSDSGSSKLELKKPDTQVTESLQIPQRDLTIKSKMVPQSIKPDFEESCFSDFSLKESPSSDDELKTKTQESEATEYLQFSEFPEPSENESVERNNVRTPPPEYESKEKTEKALSPLGKKQTHEEDENPENLALTKIGYKMYDNLTRLSLDREKKATTRAEANGCGCNENEVKKSPFNITFESSSSMVKVTVPENELNFQIVHSQGQNIQIGVTGGGSVSARKEQKQEQKNIVRREELWHSDGGGRATVLQNERNREAAFQKLKVSLPDNKDVVFSIEMSERDKTEEKAREKRTKEMKVGTDDFDLAGGDFACASGGSQKNLSPRIGRLLKHLHEKLESDERERKFLDEKINQKLLDQKAILPGVFLVKHISPRNQIAKKHPEVPGTEKPKTGTERSERIGQLREYYCEECLATMRIFEDKNPSVKSMVDKFETIIQLESY